MWILLGLVSCALRTAADISIESYGMAGQQKQQPHMGASARYEPTWDSLDSRPLPSWYDEAKIGIFVHWGLFSVPAFGSEWFQWAWQGLQDPRYVKFVEENYPLGFKYGDLAPKFTAELFDADQWAAMFKDAGAQYVVFTTKHHEGWCNWNSSTSWNWNSVDAGPHRDLVQELTSAVRKQGLRMGLYATLFEWFNPKYLSDKANGYNTSVFVDSVVRPALHELVDWYRPDLLWSDGDWEGPEEYWKSKEFLAWLFSDSEVRQEIVVNDRWGGGSMCKHGSYWTCADNYQPGHLVERKWENAFTMQQNSFSNPHDSWGANRNATIKDYLTAQQIVAQIVVTVSCGGNVLINVGPSADGTIAPIYQERLMQMGSWLEVNGEAIYSSQPWRVQNDTKNQVWYTTRGEDVYAMMLQWPDSGSLFLEAPLSSDDTQVSLLGSSLPCAWSTEVGGLKITLPLLTPNTDPATPSQGFAWVLRLVHVK